MNEHCKYCGSYFGEDEDGYCLLCDHLMFKELTSVNKSDERSNLPKSPRPAA